MHGHVSQQPEWDSSNFSNILAEMTDVLDICLFWIFVAVAQVLEQVTY